MTVNSVSITPLTRYMVGGDYFSQLQLFLMNDYIIVQKC